MLTRDACRTTSESFGVRRIACIVPCSLAERPCRTRRHCKPPSRLAGCTIEMVRVPMKSQIVKRSVVIAAHRKSISLEEIVWRSLKEIATYRDMTLVALLATIDSRRNQGDLSSAIRLFVLNFYREQLEIQDRHKAIEATLRGSIRLH
jgi:predicted DNA-binding ribbon-helix-helix protein